MRESQALAALSALSEVTRLRIVRHLVTRGEAGEAAGAIARAVGATPSRASFHLTALERSGLIVSERRSRQVVYRLDFACAGALIGYLLEDCCGGDARVLDCCGLTRSRPVRDATDADRR